MFSRSDEEWPGLDVRVDAIEPKTGVRVLDDCPAEAPRVSELEGAALEPDVSRGERHGHNHYEAANPNDHLADEPAEPRRHWWRVPNKEFVFLILPHR
jgi:hypothetical protein